MTPDEIEADRINQAKQSVYRTAAPTGRAPTADELAKRRAAAKDRQAAATAQHAPALELAEVEAEEKLAEIVERRGPLAACIVVTPAGPIVLERGSDATWKAFFAMAQKKNPSMPEMITATRRFVSACIVYPANFDALFEDVAGAIDPCANALTKLYGFRSEEDDPK